jgi:hypothetical protein
MPCQEAAPDEIRAGDVVLAALGVPGAQARGLGQQRRLRLSCQARRAAGMSELAQAELRP